MGVDLFVVTQARGMAPAESVRRLPLSANGQAVIANLRAETAAVTPKLFRTGNARVSVRADLRDKLRFELVTASMSGPKPVAVFVNEMHRLRKGGWKLGVPWAVAFAAFDDDSEPVAWKMATEQAWKLEGVRLTDAPPRVPWCVLVVSSHAEEQLAVDFVGSVIDALREAWPVAVPADLGGV